MILLFISVFIHLAMSPHRKETDRERSDAHLRKAAGSQSIETLREAIRMGEWTAKEIDLQASTGKSALHMAAWKGCMENVQFLLSFGCNIDEYSRGEFTYGKTAIFFAATQSRDDVVEMLLKHGAWVKIVNNKGQSPLSIASSHLSAENIETIQSMEKRQVGPWWNFRVTHSDGLEYGDLDPRFLDRPLRSEDIVTPLAVNPTTKETRRGGFLRRNPHIAREAAKLLQKKQQPKPRKEQPPALSKAESTEMETSWKTLELGFRKHTELDCVQDFVNFVRLADKQQRPWIPDAVKKLLGLSNGNITRIELLIESSISRATHRQRILLQKLLQRAFNPDTASLRSKSSLGPEKLVKSLKKPSLASSPWREACTIVRGLSFSIFQASDAPILTLPQPPQLVDNMEKLASLNAELKDCSVVAIDTEWHDVDGTSSNIATIQVAYRDGLAVKAFIVDLLPNDHKYHEQAKRLVKCLFQGETIILGFAFYRDVRKLEEFVGSSLRHDFLDIQQLMSSRNSCSMPGLKACVARFSTIPLSKNEQCSDWGHRPLSHSQLEYAALDAAVLLVLLAEISRVDESY